MSSRAVSYQQHPPVMSNTPPKKINQFYLPDFLTVELIASNFISFTPLWSYGTTILSIYKKQSSHGFSIDICATMLVASTLRIAYYFIIPYEIALLRQSIVMIFIQLCLLKVSLRYRSKEYDVENLEVRRGVLAEIKELVEVNRGGFENIGAVIRFIRQLITILLVNFIKFFDFKYKRIGEFWQWNEEKYYWIFLMQLAGIVSVLTFLMKDYLKFGGLLGTIGLFVESLLPLPQILLLHQLKSVEGFKLLLLLSWLCGDFTKIGYLIFGAKNISVLFIIFALFQMALDFYIAFQFIYYKYYFIKEPTQIEMRELQSSV